jgi:peptidoglycan L-alanyl-D-glutamate endopeptidase CwlK
MALSKRDKERLAGVDPRLVRLFREVAKQHPDTFIVTEGKRSKERQAEMVRRGASRTYYSRHLSGRAVDVAVMENGKVTWDFDAYRRFAEIVKAEAAMLDMPIVWGGDWAKLRDGPHFELPNGW